MILRKITLLSVLLLSIASCVTPQEKPMDLSVSHAEDKGPKLDIKDYLNGSLEGFGFVEDEKGFVTKRFTAKVNGSWDGDRAVVKRSFLFGDDKKDDRTWLITIDKNEFSAVAHEIIGTATGQQYKGVAQMIYKAKMPFGGVIQETKVIETTYNIDGKSSISILEFNVNGKSKGKMILSLHKVKTTIVKKPVESLEKNLDEAKEPSEEN